MTADHAAASWLPQRLPGNIEGLLAGALPAQESCRPPPGCGPKIAVDALTP
jgi:hypothetical protein